MSQKPTKTITDTTYTTTDEDSGYRIICDNASGVAITLHTATGKYNFDLEIDNVGVGDVTVGGQTISQYTHAHIGCDGTSWIVVIGGGGGASDFADLGDVPGSYSGEAGKFVAVNSEESGLEFVSAPADSSGSFDYGLITDSTSTSKDYGGLS